MLCCTGVCTELLFYGDNPEPTAGQCARGPHAPPLTQLCYPRPAVVLGRQPARPSGEFLDNMCAHVLCTWLFNVHIYTLTYFLAMSEQEIPKYLPSGIGLGREEELPSRFRLLSMALGSLPLSHCDLLRKDSGRPRKPRNRLTGLRGCGCVLPLGEVGFPGASTGGTLCGGMCEDPSGTCSSRKNTLGRSWRWRLVQKPGEKTKKSWGRESLWQERG